MIYRNISTSSPLSKVKVGVTSNIILGSPKKNCDGIGICRIERHIHGAQPEQAPKRCCKARALLIDNKGELVFYFIRHTLAPCVLSKQFIRGHFVVNETVSIPDDISVELGFPPDSYIDTGQYRVVDLGVHLCVAVRVSNKQRQALGLAV